MFSQTSTPVGSKITLRNRNSTTSAQPVTPFGGSSSPSISLLNNTSSSATNAPSSPYVQSYLTSDINAASSPASHSHFPIVRSLSPRHDEYGSSPNSIGSSGNQRSASVHIDDAPPTNTLYDLGTSMNSPGVIPEKLSSPLVTNLDRAKMHDSFGSQRHTVGGMVSAYGSQTSPSQPASPLYGQMPTTPIAYSPMPQSTRHSEFRSSPPPSSVAASPTSQKVVVFGFPHSSASYIRSVFEKLGKLKRHDCSPGQNWMELEYYSPQTVSKALDLNGKVMEGIYMIGVKQGDASEVTRPSQPPHSTLQKPVQHGLGTSSAKISGLESLSRSYPDNREIKSTGSMNIAQYPVVKGKESPSGEDGIRSAGIWVRLSEYLFGW